MSLVVAIGFKYAQENKRNTMSTNADSIASLITARRIMLRSEQLSARQKDPKARVQSAKEAMEEDQALLSGEALSAAKADANVRIGLTDLQRELHNLSAQPARRETLVIERQVREVEVSLKPLPQVDGLVVRSKRLAETDRYEFEFSDGHTFKITDKWSGKSTTIWGDPHVDTSDQEGDYNGDFSDLTGSETHTTLALQDGTRVTFTAHDQGVIERVDIFHSGQHLSGVGAASASWSDENGLFAAAVDHDAASLALSTPRGDLLRAGGDGNDWFDAQGKMIWGQTTSAPVTSRPYASMEVLVRQRVEQLVYQRALQGGD
jgi:hypothetical protein